MVARSSPPTRSIAPPLKPRWPISAKPGASPPDAYPLDGSPDVRSALIAARDDEFFVLDWSRAVARELLGTEAIEIATGHFPMIEQPAELARLLEAAGA